MLKLHPLMRSPVLFLSLWSLVAVAQTTQPLTVRAADGTDTLAIKASQCGGSVTARWAYAAGIGNLCTPLKLWATAGECSEAGPGTTDTRYEDIPLAIVTTQGSDNFSIKVGDLPGFKAGSTTPCGTDGVTVTHKICGVIEYSTYQCGLSTQLKLSASPLKVVYDRQPPGPPVITETVAQDKAVTLKFTVGSDTTIVRAEYKGPSDADFRSGGEVGVSATQIRVGGLVNGNTYSLRLRAVDQAENTSAPSEEVGATPVRTEGFWGVYREKGGSDPGGCASAAGPTGVGLPMVSGLLAWALRRRSKR